MNVKEQFIEIYNQFITREGADKLLEFLVSESNDFFIAPASTRYHSAHSGGLVEHSIKVRFYILVRALGC